VSKSIFPTKSGIRFVLSVEVARTVLAIREEHDGREHIVKWSGFSDPDAQLLADAVCRWAHDPAELARGTHRDRLCAKQIRSFLDREAVMPTPCQVVDQSRIESSQLR
jgi:hypothetical protein